MTGPVKTSPTRNSSDTVHNTIAYQPFILFAELTLTPASINLVTAAKSPTQEASRNDSSITKPTIKSNAWVKIYCQSTKIILLVCKCM